MAGYKTYQATAFNTSNETNNYKSKLSQLESSKPADYSYSNQTLYDNVLDSIMNRKDFSYDFNADPIYQQYKDQYTTLGNQAMQNTVANASALTGGYGNSYSVTAGAQANQQYLNQLNNIIPELYQAAMDKYELETDSLNSQYDAIANDRDFDYSKYQDTLSQWNTDRDYYNNAYQNSYSRDFNLWDANNQNLLNEIESYNSVLAANSSSGSSSKTSSDDTDYTTSYQNINNTLANMLSYYKSGKVQGGSSGYTASVNNYINQQLNSGAITEDDAEYLKDLYTNQLNTDSSAGKTIANTSVSKILNSKFIQNLKNKSSK